MKQKFTALLLALFLLCSLTPSAAAAGDEATQAAEKLYELNLFRGTGTNTDGTPVFDLDKTPSRNQAIIMLVRLLGKEAEALSGSWDIPFTDVADSVRPYIGYAYTHGLTNGTSATTYSGTNPIWANQYVTFILRALGYVSGEDFEVASPWDLSDSLGITRGQPDSTAFTRGDTAILSYAALSASIKGTSQTLQERLLADGTICAWYEVDELGRLFLKTNLTSNPKTGYSVLNRRYLKGGGFNHDGQYGWGSSVVYDCNSSFYFGDSSRDTFQTDFYVFDNRDALGEFWDNWDLDRSDHAGDNGFSQAIAAVSDHILVKFVLDTDVCVEQMDHQFDVTDFSITYDREKGQETYTASISEPIKDTGEYGLIYKGNRGQSHALSYMGRNGNHLEYTREIDHFAQAGTDGTLYISHCAHSQDETGRILCQVRISSPIAYQFPVDS